MLSGKTQGSRRQTRRVNRRADLLPTDAAGGSPDHLRPWQDQAARWWPGAGEPGSSSLPEAAHCQPLGQPCHTEAGTGAGFPLYRGGLPEASSPHPHGELLASKGREPDFLKATLPDAPPGRALYLVPLPGLEREPWPVPCFSVLGVASLFPEAKILICFQGSLLVNKHVWDSGQWPGSPRAHETCWGRLAGLLYLPAACSVFTAVLPQLGAFLPSQHVCFRVLSCCCRASGGHRVGAVRAVPAPGSPSRGGRASSLGQ